MKRSVFVVLFLLCAPFLIIAQSVWEGSCAVGAYGTFPSTGLYGASNSFPQNTLVTVENPNTNQKATVLIIDRLNDTGLFMLLSRDAGSALGLGRGQVVQVRVTLANRKGSVSQGPGDLPYSTDPDVFPAASVGNPKSLSFLDQYLNTGKPGSQAASKTAAEQPSQSATRAPQKPSTAPALAEQPTSKTPQGAATESGAAASPLTQRPSQKATTGEPSVTPPAPLLAQSESTRPSGSQGSAAPPQPAVPSGPAGTPTPAGTSSEEVPSPSGVASGAAPAQSTTQGDAGTASLAPAPSAPAPVGPVASNLEAAQTPSAAAPPVAELASPSIPERAGSAPVVTQLQSMEAPGPKSGGAVALAESPAVPEIRNPGPSTSSIAAASPPSAQMPSLAMDLPNPPGGKQSGPEVTGLAQASPSPVPYTEKVSALPSIPTQPSAVAATRPAGPLVSALAPAQPPQGGAEVAQAELPLPSVTGMTPQATALASGEPPGSPAAPTGPIPAPEVAQKQPAPAPTTPAQRAPAVAQAKPSSAPPPARTPQATGTSAARMVGRIPVRPSSALSPASYYLQLGVYGESSSAVALADNLSPDYPVSVYAFSQNKKPLYKVMIGPLNSDESGTLLYQFMAQGYKDAFVRKGE